MNRISDILCIGCVAALLTTGTATAEAYHGNPVGRLACLTERQASELQAMIEYDFYRVPERHAMRVHAERMEWLAQRIKREAEDRGRVSLIRSYVRQLETRQKVLVALLDGIERRAGRPARHHGIPDTRLIRHQLCQLDTTLDHLTCLLRSGGDCGVQPGLPLPHVGRYRGPVYPHSGRYTEHFGPFGSAFRSRH